MNDLALLLAGDLETYTGLEAAVTFGEPADPTGTGCELIKVWVVSVQPREHRPANLYTLSRLTLAFRLYSCYPVQERDLTAAQEESAALDPLHDRAGGLVRPRRRQGHRIADGDRRVQADHPLPNGH